MKLTNKRKLFVDHLIKKYGSGATLTNTVINDAAKEIGIGTPNWFLTSSNWRVERGQYRVPYLEDFNQEPKKEESISSDTHNPKDVNMDALSAGYSTSSSKRIDDEESLVPNPDSNFVPFGFFHDLKSIIGSDAFFPVFITGMSGNGKSFMPRQAAAETKREFIRVNITGETDEDDLIGGFRLIDGQTKFFKGPVIQAMERGAIVMLDEIDLGNPSKIMCLQSILEGDGYFIKKTGEYVSPKKGFSVIATANTKGRGSETGHFIGTNILNEAFLERFVLTFEHDYPTTVFEEDIIRTRFRSLGMNENDPFIKILVEWANNIRETYKAGGTNEIVSTRRLVHIVHTYAIFGERAKAVRLCLSRFDEETSASFYDIYTKIDAEVAKQEELARKRAAGETVDPIEKTAKSSSRQSARVPF